MGLDGSERLLKKVGSFDWQKAPNASEQQYTNKRQYKTILMQIASLRQSAFYPNSYIFRY